MKVLQINSVYGIGSTGRIVKDISNILLENGYGTRVCYGRGSHSDELAVKISNPWDNRVHGLVTRIFDAHGFASKGSSLRLIHQISDFKPDIIHLHNLHGYYLNIAVLFDFLEKHGKPVIWTLHDCWAFTGHCAHFDFAGCEKWKTECNHCPQKFSYPKSMVFDGSGNNFLKKKAMFTKLSNMTIATPSLWLKERVSESFLGKYTTEVINNGIDTKLFFPKRNVDRNKYGIADEFIILGAANVWNDRKGFEYFIELSEQLDPKKYKILLVGINPSQQKNLPKTIVGMGKTADISQLSEIYSMADVFLNPTLEDTYPTTNLEALACGTPVITFNTGGSPESLTPECGIVTEDKSVEGILRALIKVQNGELSRTACAQRGEQFSAKEKFKEYISLYERVLRE